LPALAAVAWLAGCSSGGQQQAQFVGSEKCADVHKDEYKSWQGTWHAKMVRPANQFMLKDASDNWAKDAKVNAGPTKANISGAAVKKEDVVMVVGARWKQRYLVKNLANGGHQFLDKPWNTVHKQWEPYGQANTWEGQCATCHVTGYKVVEVDEASRAVKKWDYAEKNVGCQSCHGPGSKHVASQEARDIFNPKNASLTESSKVCGYCHIRVENTNFKTPEGKPSEQLPHPVLGQSYRAGLDDWTQWYPDKVLLVGIQPEEPVSKNYPGTDLNNAFWLDEQFAKTGIADARKHHEQYQEHVQSKHHGDKGAACASCHMPHAVAGKKMVAAKDSCASCHKNEKFDLGQLMPGVVQTAQNLFVQAHTFNPKQARKGGPVVPAGAPEPAYVGGK
jgi:hypothetical protein